MKIINKLNDKIKFNLHIESYQNVLSYKHQQKYDINSNGEFYAMAY